MVVILLGAILLFLGFAALLWYAFSPNDEWSLDDRDHDYFPFWKGRR